MPPPVIYPSKKLVSGKEYPWIFKKYLCSDQNIKKNPSFVFLFAQVQGPTSGSGQSQAQIQARWRMD